MIYSYALCLWLKDKKNRRKKKFVQKICLSKKSKKIVEKKIRRKKKSSKKNSSKKFAEKIIKKKSSKTKNVLGPTQPFVIYYVNDAPNLLAQILKRLKTIAIYWWASLPIITLWVTQLSQICRLLVDVVYEWSLPNAKLLQVAVEIPTVLKSISSRDQVNVLITSKGFLLHNYSRPYMGIKPFFFSRVNPFFDKERGKWCLFSEKDIDTYVKAWIKRCKIRISLDLNRCVIGNHKIRVMK